MEQVEVPQPGMRDMMKGKMSTPSFTALVQDPGDPKVFYAGGSWSKDMGGSAVNKSMNGGKKWDAAGSGITGDVKLLRSPAPGIVFAAAGKDGVFRTADGGKSWSSIRPGDVNDLAVDPTKPERVYVATKEGLYRSSDSGATWSKATLKGDEFEAVVVSPTDGKVFAGTFGGVFVSADGGATWKPLNDGLTNVDVRALAIGGSPARLYAGIAGGSVQSIELP